MTPREMSQLLVAHYVSGLYLEYNLMFLSPPGEGKTGVIRTVSEFLANKYDGFGHALDWDVRGPTVEPTDLRGLFWPDHKMGITKSLPTDVLPIEGTNCPDRGLLYIGEVPNAPRHTKPGLHQILTERRIGRFKIKKGWAIVADGNRIQDECDVDAMGAALRNRFSIVEVMTDLDTLFGVWDGTHTNIEYEDLLRAEDPPCDPVNRTKEFLKENPKSLRGSVEHMSFASARAWTWVVETAKRYDWDNNIFKEVVSGLVGTVGPAYVEYLKQGNPHERMADNILSGKTRVPLKLHDIRPVFQKLALKTKSIEGQEAKSKAIKTVLSYMLNLDSDKIWDATESWGENDPVPDDTKRAPWHTELVKKIITKNPFILGVEEDEKNISGPKR